MWILTLLLALPLLSGVGETHVLEPIFQEDGRTQEKMIDRRYAVKEGGTLAVRLGDSDVEVLTGSAGEVHVEVYLEGRDMDRARDYFERQHFSVAQDGATVRVESKPERTRWSWRDWRDHPRIITRVHVPERFDAELRTSDGDVRVERLRGQIYLKTSDGDIDVGTLAGTDIVLDTSDGDIHLESLEAETLDIKTSDGDLDLGTVRARRITARTSDGDVRVHRLDGEAELKTSDGDVRLDTFLGPSLFVRTADGDITIDALSAGRSEIRSSEGTIVLRRVEGALDVTGSDTDIHVTLVKPREVSLTTSDGDITITAPKNLPATLHLRGDDVRLSSSFAFDGEISDERARGRINGGGPQIEARTSDGDVTLRAR